MPGFVGFFSVVFFIRILGASQYGQYSFLLSQCNLIVALAFGWLNQSQLRYYSKYNSYKDYSINQIIAFIFSLIISLIVLTILIYYQNLSNRIWLVSIITIVAIGSFNYLKTLYQAKLLPVNIIFITSIQSFLSLLIPLVIVIFYKNAVSLLLGVAFSFLISTLITTKSKMINLTFGFLSKIGHRNNFQLIKKWFIYGSPLSIWFAAGLALAFLDRYFINFYFQNMELGVYASLQEILVRSFSLTIFPFTLAIHPRIMDLWNNSKTIDAIQLLLKSIYLIIGLGLFLMFIVWSYDDLIFLFMKKLIPQFEMKSKFLIFPLLCSGFLWQLSFLTHKMLELKEQTILMLLAILPSLIINIIGNNYFLPKLGIIATAYTSLFSALVYCILTGIHFIYSIYKVKVI